MSSRIDTSTEVKPTNYKPSCVERPLTKAALFVIAFLLAGGAIASHFTGLGTIAVASFGAGGGVVLTAAIAVSLYARYKERHEAVEYTVDPSSFRKTTQIPPKKEPSSFESGETSSSSEESGEVSSEESGEASDTEDANAERSEVDSEDEPLGDVNFQDYLLNMRNEDSEDESLENGSNACVDPDPRGYHSE